MESSIQGAVAEAEYLLGATISDADLPVLLAQHRQRPGDALSQTPEAQTFTRMFKVMASMSRLIQDKQIELGADCNDLAGALMYYEGNPSHCLGYIRGTTNSLVDRKLHPRELVNVLGIYQTISDQTLTKKDLSDPRTQEHLELRNKPSVATIIRIADDWGLDLMRPIPDDEAEDVITALDEYEFVNSVSRASKDGEPYQTHHLVQASTRVRNPIGFTAIIGEEAEPDYKLMEYMINGTEFDG